MDLRTAIEKRASCRRFTSDPVSVANLREMARLAGCAPSLNNAQPWRYIAVIDEGLKVSMVEEVRRKLDTLLPGAGLPASGDEAEALVAYCTLFGRAPAFFAVATRTYEAVLDQVLVRAGLSPGHASVLRGNPDIVSLGASIQNLLLAATALGYGSCWMTGPLVAARELESLLNLEPPWRLGAVVAIGKPASEPKQSPKNRLEAFLEVRD